MSEPRPAPEVTFDFDVDTATVLLGMSPGQMLTFELGGQLYALTRIETITEAARVAVADQPQEGPR